MKIRVVSSREEITTLDPNERIVHLAFRPSNKDIFGLVETCPKIEVLQLPKSYRRTVSKSIEMFLEMERIQLVEGDVWGDIGKNINHKDTYYKKEYIFTTFDCMGNRVALKHKTFTEKIVPAHPEITIDHIKDGIEFAKHVRRDINKNRLYYYKTAQILIQGKNYSKNIKIVAEITANCDDCREIVTSYVFRLQDLGKELARWEIVYDADTTSKD